MDNNPGQTGQICNYRKRRMGSWKAKGKIKNKQHPCRKLRRLPDQGIQTQAF